MSAPSPTTAPSLSTASASSQRRCTRPSCSSTAVYRYSMAGTAWYRCDCGLEFPLTAAPSA